MGDKYHLDVRKLRGRLFAELESSKQQRLSVSNRIVVVVIVASVVLGVLGTEPAVQEYLGGKLIVLELAMGLFFVVEFLARLWAVGITPRFTGFRGVVRYICRPLSIVDLVVIASLLAPYFGAEFTVLRLLRILRLVALAKFGRYSSALRQLVDAFARRRYELIMSVVVAALVFLIAATGMYAIEAEVQPDAFGSIPRALWWSLTTLTTVGYGDVYPVTPLGRVFAGFTAMAGIGLIAMPTGILAAAFSEVRVSADSSSESDASEE